MTDTSGLRSANDAPAPATRSIECEIRTPATPEQAWAAWGDPQKLAQWFVERARGEAKTGSVMYWEFDERFFSGEIPYPVAEAEPPDKLVFAGTMPGRPPWRLEITIRRERGETVLRLVNSGFLDGSAWDEEYEGVSSGWQMALALLAYYLTHHYGEVKRTIMTMRPAEYAVEQVRDWFTQEALLSRWLTTSGQVGAPGERVRLTLSDGGTITGVVLAATKREISLSWEEEDVVLELKAFQMGPGPRMVGLRATAWGERAAREKETGALEARLERVTARLADAMAADRAVAR
jgi:uncharacterized protein YndB with AHSA1/START domain